MNLLVTGRLFVVTKGMHTRPIEMIDETKTCMKKS